jgi:hypothetical protein
MLEINPRLLGFDSNFLRDNYYKAAYFARKFSDASFIISPPKRHESRLKHGVAPSLAPTLTICPDGMSFKKQDSQ